MKRVNFYIDGFNLYFGMTETLNNVKWLNIYDFCNSILKNDQTLNKVHYFTSRISNNPPKERRQSQYIDALKTTPINIHFGKYKNTPVRCYNCGHTWDGNEEKMTDVNIAIQMIVDAMKDDYDVAILISGDSDLVPPIREIKSNFPAKKVTVAFPPNRFGISLKNIAHAHFMVGKSKLLNNQFPDQVVTANGYVLNKPNNW